MELRNVTLLLLIVLSIGLIGCSHVITTHPMGREDIFPINKGDNVNTSNGVITPIEKDGWFKVKSKGSHRQFKHPIKTGRVTIAGNLSDELAPKTLKSVFRQAKIEKIEENK